MTDELSRGEKRRRTMIKNIRTKMQLERGAPVSDEEAEQAFMEHQRNIGILGGRRRVEQYEQYKKWAKEHGK